MTSDQLPPQPPPTTTSPPPPQPPPYQPQAAPYYPAPERRRPLGVTLLAILEILSGIGMLFIALGMFALAALTSNQDFIDAIGPDVPQWIIDNGGVLFGVMGGVMLIFAFVAFLLAWGFLKGKGWARLIGIIFAVLSIISSVISGIATGSLFSIATLGFSIIIPVLILVYLLLPSTKAWFTH